MYYMQPHLVCAGSMVDRRLKLRVPAAMDLLRYEESRILLTGLIQTKRFMVLSIKQIHWWRRSRQRLLLSSQFKNKFIQYVFTRMK